MADPTRPGGAERGSDAPPTWAALRARVEADLAGVAGDRAPAEARWMAREAAGFTDVELVEEAANAVPALVRHRVEAMVARRVAGEPLQYVLGTWSFRGVDLMVDRRVLIPRPETEVVAQAAIDELVRRGARVGRADPWAAGLTEFAVADLGTGSGAIALALAAEVPDAAVWATDVSAAALAVARANLASIGTAATRVRVVEGDWFDALPGELRGTLRLVVSNPPYVSVAEHAALPPEVATHEPYGALVAGPTGLECIARIVGEARDWLEPGGALVLEMAPHQAGGARASAVAAGFVAVEVRADLAGRERVLVATAPG